MSKSDALIHGAVMIPVLILLGYIFTLDRSAQESVFVVLSGIVAYWYGASRPNNSGNGNGSS